MHLAYPSLFVPEAGTQMTEVHARDKKQVEIALGVVLDLPDEHI